MRNARCKAHAGRVSCLFLGRTQGREQQCGQVVRAQAVGTDMQFVAIRRFLANLGGHDTRRVEEHIDPTLLLHVLFGKALNVLQAGLVHLHEHYFTWQLFRFELVDRLLRTLLAPCYKVDLRILAQQVEYGLITNARVATCHDSNLTLVLPYPHTRPV